MSKKQSIGKTEFLTRVGVLTAVATVMYLFLPEIPIFTDHLKFDISDLPVMLAALTTGPAAGVAVLVIKNIFHLFKSTTFGVGEVVNILVGSTMVFSLLGSRSLIARLFKKSKSDHAVYLSASAVTTVITVAAGFVFNLALTPVFLMLIGTPVSFEFVLSFCVMSLGLNVVKSLANTLLTYPIYLAVQRFEKPTGGKTAKI